MRVFVLLGATCLMALVAIFLAGPDDDEASVIFILENRGTEPIFVSEFQVPGRLWGRRDLTFHLGGVTQPGRAFAKSIPAPADFPPGRQEATIVWSRAPSAEPDARPPVEQRVTVPFDPILRKTCDLVFAINNAQLEVEPCRNPYQRFWFSMDLD